MRKEKTIYHDLFRKTAAFRLALAVIFAMFINMLNFPALIEADYVGAGEYVLEVESKIGKIYGAVNIPVHIVNEIFKNNMSFADTSGDKQGSEKSFLYALVNKGAEKAGEESLFKALVSYGSGFYKVIMKNNSLSSGILYGNGSCILNYLESNDIIRFMLLFLMLLLVLPRGIPVKFEKIKNINFAFPVFIL